MMKLFGTMVPTEIFQCVHSGPLRQRHGDIPEIFDTSFMLNRHIRSVQQVRKQFQDEIAVVTIH